MVGGGGGVGGGGIGGMQVINQYMAHWPSITSLSKPSCSNIKITWLEIIERQAKIGK